MAQTVIFLGCGEVDLIVIEFVLRSKGQLTNLKESQGVFFYK